MASEFRKIQKGKVIPDDLAEVIRVNSFRPVRCLRLLYKYNSSHFNYIMRKLGISKDIRKCMCDYFRKAQSVDIRQYPELVEVLSDLGVLVCNIADNDSYFYWLFSLSPRARKMLLAQDIITLTDYKKWIHNMNYSKVALYTTDVDKVVRETKLAEWRNLRGKN